MAALLSTASRDKQIIVVDTNPSVKDRVLNACHSSRFGRIGLHAPESDHPIVDFADQFTSDPAFLYGKLPGAS